MLIKIDRRSKTPIYRQIIAAIRQMIDQGILENGKPLPASRSLASNLGVDRSTVYQAYGELQALGYLKSRPGSYNIVQNRKREAAYIPDRSSRIDWPTLMGQNEHQLACSFKQTDAMRPDYENSSASFIDFTKLDIDHRLYPLEDFRRCVRMVLHEDNHDFLPYGDAQGYPSLRRVIANRLRLHGIAVSEKEILITSGALEGLDLISRLFDSRINRLALESPSYSSAIKQLQYNGWKLCPVAMKAGGMDLQALERILRTQPIAFVFTIPNFHNPTGITTSHNHREKLLQICEKYGVPLVEDGFEEDMKYFGKLPLPVKSLDDGNGVIYLGSFSKSLFPGLRVGWITADRHLIRYLTVLKKISNISSCGLSQAIMYSFCQNGFYDQHLKRMHRIFRRRLQITLKTMQEYFPASVSWTRPQGGFNLWIKMPRRLNAEKLRELLLPYQISVSPGEWYFPDCRASEYFRISISRLNEEEIRSGIIRLSKALRALPGNKQNQTSITV